MDKIKKFLQKLSSKERLLLQGLIKKTLKLKLDGLNVKALKGFKDVYRLKKGTFRIVYKVHQNRAIIIAIDYRKDVYR